MTKKEENEIKKYLGDDKFLVSVFFVDNGKLMDVSYAAEKELIKTEGDGLVFFYKKALSKIK